MNDHDFDTWFDLLQELLGKRGIKFFDQDSVRDDYDMGRSPEEVADIIEDEYK